MKRAAVICALVTAWITIGCAAAQDTPPDGPFKTVHLVTLNPDQQAKLSRAITEINGILAKAGYPNARYRLYKVSGKQHGQYSHLWEASWSGRAEYEKIHKLPAYQEANALFK